jgi:TIR domain/AAA domain, putative AbiEii toxin, Type IV TA system
MMAMAQRTNVFFAYSRTDWSRAERLLHALKRFDFSIWWDVESIPLGVDWERFLTDQVAAAQCVVVLWSRASVQSRWVLFEAEFALRRKVLLPVFIEEVELPSIFSRVQTGRLVDWSGDTADPEFQRLIQGIKHMIEAAPSTPDETRIYKESQRSVELRAEELFQQNLRSESVLEYVELEGTLFHDRLSWNVTPGVNVLLGRNGYGKTLLLRSLLALLQYDDQAALQTLGKGGATLSILRQGREQSIHFSDQFFDEDDAVGKLPVLAIPDTRFIDRSVTTLGAVADETTEGGDRADLARFGARHFLAERPYESLIQGFLYGLCLDYFEEDLSFQGEQFALVRDVVRELTDQAFEFDRVAREGRDRFTLYVRTEGNEDNPLPIQKCSQGTSSVIAMFGLIYEYLKSLRHDQVHDIRQRCGIVVIDEVDAHLHPLWQQKIVTLLRDRFPRVQFILTAHNPIVVAGCLEDEVCVLRRNSARGFGLVQFPNDFIGWQTEEIYRKVFEIENPDATFTRLDAMRPFKQRLREQAAALESQPGRSADQERSLTELDEQIRYIENVEETRARRLTQEEQERENRTLRDRVLGLDSAHAAAADAQRQLDELRVAQSRTSELLEAERRRAVRQRAVVIVSLIVAIAAAVVIVGLLGRPLG